MNECKDKCLYLIAKQYVACITDLPGDISAKDLNTILRYSGWDYRWLGHIMFWGSSNLMTEDQFSRTTIKKRYLTFKHTKFVSTWQQFRIRFAKQFKIYEQLLHGDFCE